MIRFKERNNPLTKFVFPGEEGFDFFLWKKWCNKNKHPVEVDPHPSRLSLSSSAGHDYLSSSDPFAAPPPPPPPSSHLEDDGDNEADFPPDSEPLTGEEEEELTNLLRNLSATKSSIKTGADWINSHDSCGNDIAVRLQQRIELTNEFDHRLAIIYLIHEVLSSRSRSTTLSSDSSTVNEPSDNLTLCLLDKIIPILRAACLRTTEGDRDKINQIVQNWVKRKIFSEFITKQIEVGVQHSDNPSKILLKPVKKPQMDDEDLPPWMLPQSSSSSSSSPYHQRERGDLLSSRVSEYYRGEDDDRKRRRFSDDHR